MKTTVVGVFPREDDARRVLAQLVDSTLDLDAIRVLHRQPEAQRALAAEAGLPADRSVPAGILAGALLGGALGFGWGLSELPLAAAGPLFLGALGLLLGGLAGALASALTDALPVPREQLPEMAAEVDRGATVVLVRTDSLPTARALRDLFQAAGSEVLAPVPGAEEEGLVEITTPPGERGEALAGMVAVTAGAARAEERGAEERVPEGHAPFVPPWRRLWRGKGGGEPAPAAPGPAPDPRPGAAAPVMEAPLDAPVAPWERPATPGAEPAMYRPPEVADLAEDSAPRPRRRRKAEPPVDGAGQGEPAPPDEPAAP